LVRFKSRKINFQKKEKKSHEKKIVPVYWIGPVYWTTILAVFFQSTNHRDMALWCWGKLVMHF
jgi:hypothetical protein